MRRQGTKKGKSRMSLFQHKPLHLLNADLTFTTLSCLLGLARTLDSIELYKSTWLILLHVSPHLGLTLHDSPHLYLIRPDTH